RAFPYCTHVEAEPYSPFATRSLDARSGAGTGVDADVLVKLLHKLPGSFLAHKMPPSSGIIDIPWGIRGTGSP
ncbi:hypothetical protein OFN94_32195, partial [Escherichia coli]|nr:hypothetical protein [Escherichia coli]